MTKKFQFGAGFGDIVNADAAIDQMRGRNALRNELVALDNKTRDEYYALVNAENSAHERIQAIYLAIASLRDDILMLRVPPATAASLRASVSTRVRARSSLKLASSFTTASKVTLALIAKEVAALKKDIKAASLKATEDVAAKTSELKAQIEGLKKEATDLKPLADKLRSDNREKNAEKLATMNSDRLAEINRLRNRAIAGYTEVKTNKTGETYTVTVPALYNLNADEILDMHTTERSRAMKDKTRLKFHRFEGEGRSSVRVHSTRDKSDGRDVVFKALMEEIDALKSKRREAVSKDTKKALSEQIAAAEAELNKQVPLQIGQTEAETFGESTLFRLDAVDLQRDAENSTIWDKSIHRAERRRKMRTVAHVRVMGEKQSKANGLDAGEEWVSLPLVMHRPFPWGAKLLSAAVNREKIGSHFRWNVEFTVLYDERLQARSHGTGLLAVDIGWAKDSLLDADGRVRVAGVRMRKDGVETTSEILLPASFTQSMAKYDGLQALRDKKTNEFFTQMSGYRLDDIDASVRELMAEAKHSMTARKAAGKEPPVFHLRKALWILRKEKSSSAFRALLEVWYERWNHLNEWLVNGKDNLLAWRKDFYRRTAFKLASECDMLLLDADNFAKMAKIPQAESNKKSAKNDIRFDAAPSLLRDALTAAFAKTKVDSEKNHGFKEIMYSPAGTATSKTCRECEKMNESLGASRTFICGCGYTADREENATGNLMDLFIRKPAVFSCFKKVSEKLSDKADVKADGKVLAMAA